MATHVKRFLIFLFVATSLVTLTSCNFASNSEEHFNELAKKQFKHIDESLNFFLDKGKQNAKELAQLPQLKNALGKLPVYTNSLEKTKILYSSYNAYQKNIYDEMLKIHDSNNTYDLIFAGMEDGGLIQAPDEDIIGAGYNPTKRPWYRDAESTNRSRQSILTLKRCIST